MKSYRRLKLLTFFIFVTYYVISSLTQQFGTGEVFPVFSWSLYSGVPPRHLNDYGLQIIAVNQQLLAAPVFVEELEQFPVSFKTQDTADVDLSLYRQVQRLGHAIATDDPTATSLHRKRLEKFLGDKEVDYAIVIRQFDSRERWLTGKIEKSHQIAKFTSGIFQ